MPASGRHRRSAPRDPRLTRLFMAAGTGSAALALPLLTATHASAAAPAKAAAAKSAPAASVPDAATPATGTYDVVRGDSLATIARTHHVVGGWQRLYTANRSVIGADPDLIHPGEHLTLSGGGVAHPLTPAAPAAQTSARTAAPATGWTTPVGSAPIGTGYKAAGSDWSSGYHTGVDFLVNTGTPVHSVAAGTVVSAGWDGSYGNDVIIRHADGKYTLYGHLSQTLVSAGQTVAEGRQIGVSGATGNVTGPHLHFEVRTTPDYGSDIDPVAYLGAHGVSI